MTTWVYFQRPGFALYQEDGGVLTSTAQTVKRAQALRDMATRRAPNLQAAPYNPAGYEYCAFDGQRVVNLFSRDGLTVTPGTVVKTDQGDKTLAQVLTDYEITDQGIDPKAAAWDIQALREAVRYANAYTLTRIEAQDNGPFRMAAATQPTHWALTRPDSDSEYILRTCCYTQGTPQAHKPTLEARTNDPNSPYCLVSLPKDCIPLFNGEEAAPTQEMLRTLARAVDDAAANPFCLERDIKGVAYALTRGGERLEFCLENVGSFTYTGDDFVAHESHGDPAYTMGRSMLVKGALKNYGGGCLAGVYEIIDTLVRQRGDRSDRPLLSVDRYRAARNGKWDVYADARTPYMPSRSTHPETRRNEPYSTYDRYVMHYRNLIKADAANVTPRAD